MPLITQSSQNDALLAAQQNPPPAAPDSAMKAQAIDTSDHLFGLDSLEDPDYEALPENSSLSANLAAGAVAGIMEHTVMYPVDAIKTRMQVSHYGPTNIYKGLLKSVSLISSSEGAFALWRGITSVVAGAGPAHAVYFAVYEAVKSAAGGATVDGFHSPLVTSLAGASATTVSDALMNPFDVVKQRMQLNATKYPSMMRCARDIFTKEGFGAFYVSYPTTLVMNVPFAAVNFSVYEAASKMLNPRRLHDPLTHCIAGGVAGGVAAAVTTPLDVVKTFLQTRGMHQSSEIRHISSFAGALKFIYQRNGLKGLMRGLKPRVVANMPSTAISWTTYEMAKFYLCKTEGFAN